MSGQGIKVRSVYGLHMCQSTCQVTGSKPTLHCIGPVLGFQEHDAVESSSGLVPRVAQAYYVGTKDNCRALRVAV